MTFKMKLVEELLASDKDYGSADSLMELTMKF